MKRCEKCRSLMPDDVSRCIRCGYGGNPDTSVAALVVPVNGQPRRGRLANGWALATQSFRLLWLDKQLVVFPLLSTIASLLVIASFAGGMWATGIARHPERVNEAANWVFLFVYYFANYFVIVFFNSALIFCAIERFSGREPTLAGGLRAARARLAQIAAWALVAATVGVILRMIEERVGFVGKIIVALLGAAWTIATCFVVPVLVVEELGPLDAASRSVEIIKQAWGESLVSNLGIGLVVSIVTALIVIPTAALVLALAVKTASLAVAIVGAVVVIVILALSSLIGSALHSITLCALYLYATEGKVPQAFAEAGFDQAFVAKT